MPMWLGTQAQALLRPMSADAVDAAVRRVTARRPDLGMAPQSADYALTAGEGADMMNQAALQQWLWWYLPRRYPEEDWRCLADAAAELLGRRHLCHLAQVARSDQTTAILTAWERGAELGAKAFHKAQHASGVEPPDTEFLAWGSVMGSDEASAVDIVERALGEAVRSGDLVPGAPRWRLRATAITEQMLTQPLDLPPGQTLASLVLTERVERWVDSARHPLLGEWRASVANRLLNPIEPPANADDAVAPFRWLIELASEPRGAELIQSNYLARATVLAAVERFGWWDWPKPPHSEAEVHQLATVRESATRLRLVRRRGRRLHATSHGSQLLASPTDLWRCVAGETEDGEEFTQMVTELVALRVLRGRVETGELAAEVGLILAAQRWSTSNGPMTPNEVSSAIWRPLRWWRILSILDEVESTWERGTGRRMNPHTVAFNASGEATVLAYLRSRAAGPRQSVYA
jgi:hypothetical protein